MPVAILIGFEYTHNPLPGVLIDLERACRWARSFECAITLIVDQACGSNSDTESEILSQYPTLRIRHLAALRLAVTTVLTGTVADQKLIIYYSGHGVAESMILPDQTLLPFTHFRDLILGTLDPYTEIFWILDCCNPNGLHLPYKLTGENFRLSPTHIDCITHPSLLLTSSNSNEKSVTTQFGSIFTLTLFRYLNRLRRTSFKNRNLYRMVQHLNAMIHKFGTGSIQTISVYSAYMTDPLLWMWLGPNSDIVTDPTLSLLIIRPPALLDLPPGPTLNPYDLEYANEDEALRGDSPL
jgi:hypothetical protein